MPETIQDKELDRLLGFHEDLQGDEFALNVMHRVRQERRRRRLILTLCGLVGGAFGLLGAVLLSAPIARLFAGLPLIGTMQAVLIVVAAVAFYRWIMNDDVSLIT
jgi:uncharacterized protein YacL